MFTKAALLMARKNYNMGAFSRKHASRKFSDKIILHSSRKNINLKTNGAGKDGFRVIA
jgi:hypothetical protein